ncbi:MAG: putative lipase, partial [Verrucomicrobiales bacterium]|nr:putative lipase [Verrucomicrobiales bacterium]
MLVVFVHGLGGDCRSTWCYSGTDAEPDSGEFGWMEWLADDLEEEDVPCDVSTYDYPASPTDWFGSTMPLYDRAGNFLEWLCSGDLPDDVPITFVCHSLGGLLVKETLKIAYWQEPDSAKRRLLKRIAWVMFLATPHNGSAPARALNFYLKYFARPSVLLKGLEKNDLALLELRNAFIAQAKD